jgi:hypothetical protein
MTALVNMVYCAIKRQNDSFLSWRGGIAAIWPHVKVASDEVLDAGLWQRLK